MCDRVPALDGNARQRVDGQLATEDGQKPGDAASHSCLPLNSVFTVVSTRPDVHGRDHKEIHADAEVGEGQVAHEESRDGQFAAACEYHKQHREVAGDGKDVDEPDGHSQEPEAGDVLAGVERVRLGGALQGWSALTQVQLWVIELYCISKSVFS